MARTVAIGLQDFEKVRTRNVFYVDKTDFIREWWDNGDDVTLITRPRRFGKTLNMSMVEQFFSVDYANRGDLFEG
ncbi:MAG: AAA family ATPase, partial [Lachnospiraceae bacterium]|nr:AAA family ATPase [Lachnospiraceae bacterium]